jgi:hypothetical protein
MTKTANETSRPLVSGEEPLHRRPPTLGELRRELEEFDREALDRRRFRTEMKDLREGLSDRTLRERIGPFLVRVEKFSMQFIRGEGDAELGRSLFTPWISHLVGSAAEPGWRVCGGFDLLQQWCWQHYRAQEEAMCGQKPDGFHSLEAPPSAPTP